ncbi:MAG: hypothetical protein K8S54_15710 [Spirochaetia bacterium]|nr:hypothetical protein [Spirochaetia bacterium]
MPEISLLGVSILQSAAPHASCAEWNQAGALTDGDYLLTLSGGTVTVFCFSMTSSPAEYLTFTKSPSTGFPNSNYTYAASPPAGGWRKSYSRARFYPATLEIDGSDATFSTESCTTPPCSNPYHAAAYAQAAGCGAENGTGNIDLAGFSFTADPAQFAQNGAGPYNCTATGSSANTVVDLTGNGGCGWIQPSAGNGRLQLMWIP